MSSTHSGRVPPQVLADDIKAFLLKGAKDGDAPATCS